MADLQEQLQAILGDPQAMGQITAIARALTGGQPQDAPAPEPPQAQDVEYIPVDDPPGPSQAAEEPYQQGQDSSQEDSGPDLSALLGALGGGLSQVDPRLLQLALRAFTEYSTQDNEKAALLVALKPFLRPERQEKLEKAERLARLSRVVRLAFQLLKEEGDDHV